MGVYLLVHLISIFLAVRCTKLYYKSQNASCVKDNSTKEGERVPCRHGYLARALQLTFNQLLSIIQLPRLCSLSACLSKCPSALSGKGHTHTHTHKSCKINIVQSSVFKVLHELTEWISCNDFDFAFLFHCAELGNRELSDLGGWAFTLCFLPCSSHYFAEGFPQHKYEKLPAPVKKYAGLKRNLWALICFTCPD